MADPLFFLSLSLSIPDPPPVLPFFAVFVRAVLRSAVIPYCPRGSGTLCGPATTCFCVGNLLGIRVSLGRREDRWLGFAG